MIWLTGELFSIIVMQKSIPKIYCHSMIARKECLNPPSLLRMVWYWRPKSIRWSSLHRSCSIDVRLAGSAENLPDVCYLLCLSFGYCSSVAVALKAIHRHSSSRDHAPGERLRNVGLTIDVTFWSWFRR